MSLKVLAGFPGPTYHIQVDPNITPNKPHVDWYPFISRNPSKIDKMLQAGIIKPVKEAIPRINSFVLIKGKNKSGNPKFCICLDPTNWNKAVVHEPYHFKTLEDITHLITNSCGMTVCDCKKGYWHQELDKASSFLTTFNTELGRFQ